MTSTIKISARTEKTLSILASIKKKTTDELLDEALELYLEVRTKEQMYGPLKAIGLHDLADETEIKELIKRCGLDKELVQIGVKMLREIVANTPAPEDPTLPSEHTRQ